MHLISVIKRFFGRATVAEKTSANLQVEPSDIKFSTLIKSIHEDLQAANQSLQGVGLKYVEAFFNCEMASQTETSIRQKINELEVLLGEGKHAKSQQLLKVLKQEFESFKDDPAAKKYSPVMTEFELPTSATDSKEAGKLKIPLLALAHFPLPRLTAVNVTSKLHSIKHIGDELYVKFTTAKQSKSKWRRQDKAIAEGPKVSFSISTEDTPRDIEAIISHYQEQFRKTKS